MGRKLAPPYRPFRMIAHVGIAVAVTALVWLPLTILNVGFIMGPPEEVRFSSLEEAQGSAFKNRGWAWPGTRLDLRGVESGYILDRRWLWWSEVRLPLEQDLATNTARYESGPGETAQQIVLLGLALVPGVLVFRALPRGSSASATLEQGP